MTPRVFEPSLGVWLAAAAAVVKLDAQHGGRFMSAERLEQLADAMSQAADKLMTDAQRDYVYAVLNDETV